MNVDCDRDEDGNIIDQLTEEVVPYGRLISFFERNRQYCFDIDSLYRYTLNREQYVNPYTLNPLSEAVIDAIDNYAESLKIDIEFKNLLSNRVIKRFTVDKNIKLGDLILEAFRQIGGYRHLGDYSFFLRGPGGFIRLYELDLNTPLDRLDLTYPISLYYTDNMRNTQYDIIYPKWYKYALDNHLNMLLNFIPIEYTTNPPLIDEAISERAFNRMVNGVNAVIRYYDINDPRQRDRLLVNLFGYFARHNAKLTASQAYRLIDLIPDFDDKYIITHAILSRVVDRYNLDRQGVDVYYRLDRYRTPDYQINITPIELNRLRQAGYRD